MFRISLLEGMKNINRRKVVTGLTVLLFTLLFILQGYTYSYYAISEIRGSRLEHETLEEYHLYELGCKTVPGIALRLFRDGLELETAEYYEALEASEHITYVGLWSSSIAIENFKGDHKVFLRYADGVGVRCLYVTPNFYEVENYRVIEGRDFVAEDMPYVDGKPRPVLLGYKYRGVYELGEILDLDSVYYSDFKRKAVTQLEVIGFLAEDTTVISRNGQEIYDLDNYIVYPEYIIPIKEWDNYSEKVVNESVSRHYNYAWGFTKIMFTEEDEAEGLIEWRQALDNFSGMGPYWSIIDREYSMERLQSRTEALTSFYEEITAVLMFFAVVTVLISIANRVSRNMKDYAIHIAIGATKKSAVLFIISEMSIILLCSIILGMFATKWIINSVNMPFYFWQSLAIYVATSVVILALSAVITLISIRKYDICNLIK